MGLRRGGREASSCLRRRPTRLPCETSRSTRPSTTISCSRCASRFPSACRRKKVRVAFEARSVEVFAIGDKITYRFFVPKLFKPVLVERCRYEVAKSGKRVSLFLHKYDNNEWRFLKG